MTKLERMYKAIEDNNKSINEGGSHFLYNKRNEELSKLIAIEELKNKRISL